MSYNNGDIIEFECKHCNCRTAKILILKNVKIVETAICTNCNKLLYSKVVGDNQSTNLASNKVQCPYCKSFETKKISTASKVGNAAVFGVFAIGKVSKQWHCKNCNSDF